MNSYTCCALVFRRHAGRRRVTSLTVTNINCRPFRVCHQNYNHKVPTNARYVSMVSKNTDYLISSRKDTNKAARAKKFGTQIIDESEMMAFVRRGKFPSVRL